MSLIKCPECGKDFSDKAKCCPNCGISTEDALSILAEYITCPECGKRFWLQKECCPNCGIPTDEALKLLNRIDDLFPDAGRLLISKNRASIGIVQRYFDTGFNRASHIVSQLEKAGVVSPESKDGRREVLLSSQEFESLLNQISSKEI